MNNKYEKLLFIAMNISNETKTMVDGTTTMCTKGMTKNEKKAYEMGIKNTIIALDMLLEDNEWATVNINCMDRIEEIDCDKLIEILDKEKYNGDIVQ